MESTPRGIIDCIGSGFGVVHRRPALVGLPILVDAFLWLVPRVSPGPLVERLASQAREMALEEGLGPEAVSLNEQMAQAIEELRDMNLLGVLGWQVPSFLNLTNGHGIAAEPLFSVGSWGSALVVLVVVGLASALLACIFLGIIAQVVRSNSWEPYLLQQRLTTYWLRLTGYLAVVIIATLVGFPLFLLVWAALQGLNASLGALFLGLAPGVVLLVGVYLFLVKPAIFLGELGPLEALRQSFSLVHRHFWSVLGFFLLLNIISFGVGLLLVRIASLPLGLLLAVVGNAYLATGLTAAVMVYYWDRGATAQGTQ